MEALRTAVDVAPNITSITDRPMLLMADPAKEQKPVPEQPKVGKYVRGNVHEIDPKAVREKEIKKHEGVITRDMGKTWEVVDPGRDYDKNGDPIPPKHTVKEVEKDGAEVVPVPPSKQYHVKDVERWLDYNANN